MNNIYEDQAKVSSSKEKMRSLHEQEMGAKKSQLTISVILNILLALAMLAMFIISLNSDYPNIINYERAVTDRYAAWEQELTEREKVIREKERELMIEGEVTGIGE